MEPLSGTLVLVTTEVETGHEEVYNQWQDEEHVPRLLQLPGFLAAERCVAVSGAPRYLTCFHLGDAAVAESAIAQLEGGLPLSLAEGLRVQSDIAIYEQIFPEQGVVQGAEWGDGHRVSGSVLLNRFNVPPEHDDEFNAWYNTEHLPQLAAVAGSISNRRFKARKGSRLYLARYDLLDEKVPSTEPWRAVVRTPWTGRMAKLWRDPWRTLFVRLGDPILAAK